jgi:hypothetical protein
MSLFIIKTEEQLIERYPCIADQNATLAYLVALDGTPVGEFSSLIKYRNPDIFEKIMVNIRKDSLEGGSIILHRQSKPYIITMVVQDGYKGKPQMSYIHTCLNKLSTIADKINNNNIYLSKDAFSEEKQIEMKNNFNNFNLFFV